MLRTAVSLLLLAAGAPLPAQTSYGRLTSRITDPQHATIAGAAVRLTHVETNNAVHAESNGEGLVDFENLLPGAYEIIVEKEGFKKYQRSGLTVRVGNALAIDVPLEVGSIMDSIAVTGEAPLLESASASLSSVIGNRQLTDLPLAGRGVNYLMQLSPGVISTNAPMHGWLPQARDSVSNLAVAGSRTRATEFTLDGIPNMDRNGIIAFQPPPEMIQEFRVQVAPYDASLGHFSGASVTMVLKSGGNDYHGSLWFSHLSRPLTTHPFFVNKNLYDLSTGPVTHDKESRLWPATRTNRYRGQIGGPVFLPKLYNGRNRTFFTYGNDYMQRSFANLSTGTVPTAAERSGDFSSLLRLDPRYQIYDPLTIAPAPNGRFSRQPLTGNIIPANRISPQALKILNYYPLPNTAGTADGINNFFSSTASTIDYVSHMTRVDQILNERQRFYGSFSMMHVTGDQGHNLSNSAVGNLTDTTYRGLALDYVRTLSPSTILDIRYGLTRLHNTGGPPTQGLDLTTLDFPSSFTSRLDRRLTALPQININGFTAIGNNLPSLSALTTHFFSGSIAKVSGAHTFRTGADYRVLLENSYDYGNSSGAFTFDPLWTRGPFDNSAVSPIGQGLASLLLGLPSDGFIDNNSSLAEKSTYGGIFFQDDWKATRKLTVTLGLRYELEGPTTERYNRENRGFDFQAINPANAAAQAAYARNPSSQLPASQFQLRGGLLFAGVNGQPRGLWNTDYTNFAPRIGLAYLWNPQTVVRAGFGMFYDPLGVDRNDAGQVGFNQRTRLNPSNDNGQNFSATLANPYPNGLLSPSGASGGLGTYLGLSPSYFDPNRTHAYVERWSATVQRQFGAQWLIEAGYTGSRSDRIGVSVAQNATPAPYLSHSSERDVAAINFNTQNVPNPFRGIPAFSNSPAFLGNQNIELSQLLLPYPEFTGFNTTTSSGFSWYNAGHIRFERRLNRGLSLTGTYTWSKFMEAVELLNPQDRQPHRAVSPQDRPHHMIFSGIWDVPLGRGKQWFSEAPRALDALVGGWSLNVIYQWQSGPPIGFGNVIYRGSLADLVRPRGERRVEQWFNTNAGFERAPDKQLDWNLRTFPLRLTGLRADGFNNWDISVTKDIALRERVKLQLRAEAVDALNHAMFAAPNINPVSTAFGQVTATIWTEQRKITVAAKLSW